MRPQPRLPRSSPYARSYRQLANPHKLGQASKAKPYAVSGVRPCFDALARSGFIFCDLYNDCVDGTARAAGARVAGPATESLLFCDFFIVDGGTAIGIPDLPFS